MEACLKEELYRFCKDFVTERITGIERNIMNIRESLASETKSSAGDKHETGRAMLQLEREKLGKQLRETERMQHVLKRIPVRGPGKCVALGSLVQTNTAMYYISIPAGKYEQNGVVVFCISPNSPIGKQLLGKRVGERFAFHQGEQQVLQVT